MQSVPNRLLPRFVSLLVAVSLMASFASVASAAPVEIQTQSSFNASISQELQYQVEPAASTRNLIPGLEVTFQANAGATTYLRALNLSTTNVTSLDLGDNIGNTFWGTCRYSSGAAVSGVQDHYWASNLVPPAEIAITPQLRWLFVAPISGTYTCEVSVSGYSTIIHSGREVTMRIPAGASLTGQTYASAEEWKLDGSGSQTINVGNTVETLEHTYNLEESSDLTLDADIAISTCKYLSSICSGGQSGILGSSAKIQIEAQPILTGGASCGSAILSSPVTRWISSPKHHLTMNNSLTIDAASLSGCDEVEVKIKVSALDGNPIYLHGNSSIVASRVVAYEHQSQRATWSFADAQARFSGASIAADATAPSGDGQVGLLSSASGVNTSTSETVAVTPGTVVSVSGDWKLSGHGSELQLCFDVGGCPSTQALGSLNGTTTYTTDWEPFRVESEVPAGATNAYLSWSVGSDSAVDGFDWDATAATASYEPSVTPIAH